MGLPKKRIAEIVSVAGKITIDNSVNYILLAYQSVNLRYVFIVFLQISIKLA